MSIIINILILFFGLLILYQLNLAFFRVDIIEGLKNNSNKGYTSYNTNNPNNAMILAQKNAGNIEYLKDQMNSLLDFRETVKKIDTRVNDLSNQVDELILSQKMSASENFPSEPPVISGALEEDEDIQVTM
jgi:hypothetical protein